MDYPIWNIPYFGGGALIAWIAVIHVYVAHFAVGGGLFLPLTEMKGHRENSQEILDYTKRHTLFFLLITMVFGSLTGVAIWFIIALTNPAATITLIRAFTFGWSTEWVFFLGEIVTLLVYYYTFGKMRRREHLIVGWLYFVCGFMSLFMINGIIGAMLTPGDWVQTKSFWDGFFNPTFWPQLFFRAFLSFSIAGLFGFFTASRMADESVRDALMLHIAKIVCVSLVLIAPTSWWYFEALPEARQAMVLGANTEILPYVRVFFVTVPVLLALSVAMALRIGGGARKMVSLVLLLVGLAYIGSFEYTRESARRPYIIAGHMYSTQILVGQEEEVMENGWLANAAWAVNKEITADNKLAAGRELFNGQCMPCHSIAGPQNDILPLTAKFSVFGMDAQLDGQGKLRRHMPQFLGTRDERLALASFIVEELHGGDKPAYEGEFEFPGGDPGIPPFDKEKDDYVLLAWNNLGMHCYSDSEPFWVLLPPANDLYCQLVKRGEFPELVTEGVKITYKADPEFMNPSAHVRFWEFDEQLFGTDLPPNVGLAGKGMEGEMDLAEGMRAYEAKLIPVVPYPDGQVFNPYPIFTVEARDAETGELLATTRTVAPTSTEMGCKRCHGGTWRVDGVAGATEETSRDILSVHDRINKTDLLDRAEGGDPVLCQECHGDPAIGAEGRPDLPNLSAAVHGWHANYLGDREEESCAACHPNNPEGPTRCLRGQHDGLGMTCLNCHGPLEDHALSLLRGEEEAGKPNMERLMIKLKPRTVDSAEEINPRQPWVNEPDCLNCHKDFEPPMQFETFNEWTEGPQALFRVRGDQMDALRCEACHGSTHAVYPAREDSGYGENRDNIAPMQYMGFAAQIGKNNNCSVCHVDTEYTPADSAHHPMGIR